MFDESSTAEEFTDENEQNLKPGEILLYSNNSEECHPYDYNRYNQCVNYSLPWVILAVMWILTIVICLAIVIAN